MSEQGTAPSDAPRLGVRVAVAAGVLLLEYLGISLAFDSQTTQARGGVWSLVGAVGSVAPLVVVMGAALLLVPAARWGVQRPKQIRFLPVALLAHAVLAGSFYALTASLFGQPEAPAGPIALWLLAWVTSGIGSAFLLLLATVGDARWLSRVLLRALTIGGVLGLVGYSAGLLSKTLWTELSGATFRTVHGMLLLFGFELQADYEERILGLGDFWVQVAPICSGVEGLGLFLVLISGFLYQFRRSLRFPQAWLLIPLGMGLVWLGNSARIGALMVLGALYDPELAIGSFHSKAGWVAFCALTLLITWIARRSTFFSKREEEQLEEHSPATPLLMPLLAWIALGMITTAFATGHDPLYGARVLLVGALLFRYRRHYSELLTRPTWLAWGVGIAVGVLWLALPTTDERLVPGETWSDTFYFSWVALRTLGTVIVIPLCEELAFRGFLARFVTNRDFLSIRYKEISWIGILVSSIAFGLLHGRVLLAVATGVLYALVMKRSDKLIDPIAAHAASNAVIAAYVLLAGAWEHF